MNSSFENWKEILKTTLNADASGEFILPNDLPDVKRILNVCTTYKKKECYLNNGELTAEGELSYGVIYCGDDKKLHCMSCSAPFSSSVQSREESADAVVSDFLPPDTQARLSNPRKLSIKSRITVNVTAFEKDEVAPYIEGVQDSGLQYDEKTGASYAVSCAKDDGVPFSVDVKLPDTCPEPEELLCSRALAGIPTVTPSDGKADMSFDIQMMFLYRATDGTVASYRYTASVEHGIDADGMTSGSVCRGRVDVTEITGDLTTDASGEMRLIEADITYDAEVIYETAVNGVYVADMYSTEYESTAVTAEIPLRRALPVSVSHITVSGEADDENGGSVVTATVDGVRYGTEREGDNTAIDGELEVCVIENKDEFVSRTVQIPFRFVLRNAADNAEIKASAGFPSVRAEKNRLYVDAELYISAGGAEYGEAKVVRTMNISDKPVNKNAPPLRLYRPAPGECDWDIAKKYRVSLYDLQKANEKNDTHNIYIIP